MTKSATQPAIHAVGLDIAKTSFAVHGFDAEGKTVLKKELRGAQVLPFFEGLAPARVGLEACASAHHWGRELARLGHDVKLIPAQRVKAFLHRQKNDAADAQAIARAARHLSIGRRTRLLNGPRGHCGGTGAVAAHGPPETLPADRAGLRP